MGGSRDEPLPIRDLSISFGYQCSIPDSSGSLATLDDFEESRGTFPNSKIKWKSSSFSCLSGAALGANATLANTNIGSGLIGEEILPSLDSPKSFRRMASSPSLSRLDLVSSSSHGSIATLVGSASTENEPVDGERHLCNSVNSGPTRSESTSFLNAMDVQMAGGAAGEDRVQAMCSEENGWLFCGIYDGFNGRDAADFLAGTLYDNICFYLQTLHGSSQSSALEDRISDPFEPLNNAVEDFGSGVIDCLNRALEQAENDFMTMVEEEMEDRPDLVSVGCCVLAVLLHGSDLYLLNLGDSRAVLATYDSEESEVKAIQLTDIHTVDDDTEYQKLLADHPNDPSPITNGKVKGKLKLTRAFGVGYLKKSKMNDALIGILRVQNLCSPPYVYTNPSTFTHRISENDLFVVLGSDGLFDFFSNSEVVHLVQLFIQQNPCGDPAKYLMEQLIQRAAENAGLSIEDLMRIPVGRRRKYHDDVTIIVIILGNKQRTSTASTSF